MIGRLSSVICYMHGRRYGLLISRSAVLGVSLSVIVLAFRSLHAFYSRDLYPLHTKGDAPDLCRIGGVALFTSLYEALQTLELLRYILC